MQKKTLLFGMLFLLTTPLFLYAQQSVEKSESLLIIATDKVGDNVLTLLMADQSPYMQDPRAPRFLLVDSKHKLAFGIGGYVRLTTSFDFNGISNSRDFYPYLIPTPNNAALSDQLQMDASTSRLFFKLVGTAPVIGDYTSYIETDFRGEKNVMRLRQAYFSTKYMLLGQAVTTFCDLNAMPPTIDFEGPNGSTYLRNIQARYMYNRGNFSFAIAAENPNISISTNSLEKIIPQRIPDIPAYIQYAWDNQKSHIRLSGILRGLTYRNLANAKNETTMGYGGQLSSTFMVTPRFQFYMQGTYGIGISQYIADLNGNGADLVPNINKLGELVALPSMGVFAGLQYNITPKLYISGTYSQARLYSELSTNLTSKYRYGQYVVGNIFYTITEGCQIGAEYLWGEREDFNGIKGSANRVQAMLQYNF